MSAELKHYIRALEPDVQTALLLRARAIEEPDDKIAFELFTQAREYLIHASETSEVADWLLYRETRGGGWGRMVSHYKYDEKSFGANLDRLGRVWCTRVIVSSAIEDLYNGDPLRIVALCDAYHAGDYIPEDVLQILVRLGFHSAFLLLSLTQPIPNIRKLVRTMAPAVINPYATYSLENLMYVFRLLREYRYSDDDPLRFYDNQNLIYRLHGEGKNCECAHCKRRADSRIILDFTKGWYQLETHADEKDCIELCANVIAYHRGVALTWLICAKRLGVCRDIATTIGKNLYARRYLADGVLEGYSACKKITIM